MYIINIIPHGTCFVWYLGTLCFCIRNLTRSLRSLVRFLIRQQLVRKYHTPALSMKYSLYTKAWPQLLHSSSSQYKSANWNIKGVFYWNNLDQDQGSDITLIITHQIKESMNPFSKCIHWVLWWTIWSKWSWITNPDLVTYSHTKNVFKIFRRPQWISKFKY